MNSCAHCHAPLAIRRLTSRALVAAFCSYACYDAACKLKDVRAQQEGWHVEVTENAMPVHAGKERAGMIQDIVDPTRFDVIPTMEGQNAESASEIL